MDDPDFQSYFYVEKSPEGGSDLIKELKVDKSSFMFTSRTVYSLYSRQVIALEYDPAQREKSACGG